VSKLVRLAVYFILCFIALFLVSAGIRFLAIRLEWSRLLTFQPEALQSEMVLAVRWALSFTLYFSIILGLCFISKERVFALPAIVIVVVLAVGGAYCVNIVLGSLENKISEKIPTRPIGGPGLILSNPARPNSTAIVLLDGPANPGGARVVAIPDRPMVYQETFPGKDTPVTIMSQTPFGEESPWFFKNIAIDLKISADNLRQRYTEGQALFLIYTGALAILLSSLFFIMNLSAWPLANFFLCCLAFRGVLYMENMLNSKEIQEPLGAALQNYLPISVVIPLLFCVIGLLAYLYSFLIYLAKRKSGYEI